MKNLIFILGVIAVCLTSCARKAVQTEFKQAAIIQDSTTEEKVVKISIDTSSSEDVEITYTKVEYYPPGEHEVAIQEQNPYIIHTTGGASDQSSAGRASVQRGLQPKSVETYTIKKTSKKNKITKVDSSSKRDVVAVTQTAVEFKEVKKPAKDPYRWRYIFYLSLLASVVGGYFYFAKRFNPWHWVKKILRL
jgi:hypothetical protein